MNPIGWAVFVTVLMLIAGAVQRARENNPGKRLHARFAALGTLAGRSREDIVATVGPPCSVSALAEGRMLLQWQATGYHMALIFRDGTCQGVSHEFVHQELRV